MCFLIMFQANAHGGIWLDTGEAFGRAKTGTHTLHRRHFTNIALCLVLLHFHAHVYGLCNVYVGLIKQILCVIQHLPINNLLLL